jgi:phenylalanyl-tRNA synthetase beta chain
MKLSYQWLKEFTNEEISEEKMSEILTSVGLEVEHMEKKEAIPGGLAGVVIGKVLTCEKHPNADKLKLTTVDLGGEEPVQIVCGAPNVDAGQTVVVSTVGSTLYPKGGEPFKIKKAKIRGEESFGMICAEDELGLGESHDGIITISEDIKAGTPAAEYYKLPESSVQYEIGLTPNHMDAMSHMGAMKNVLAYQSNVKGSIVSMNKPAPVLPAQFADLPFEIEIKDEEKCPRYMGISIANVTIAASPDWLNEKLNSIDIAPINNVVDITNFVLHECGQPLHAFDYDKIVDHKIEIRTAATDEKFITLDDKERKLLGEDLVIANPQGAMCIAGVFGGADSGVKNETKNIFLESAFFEAVGIRKTSVHHNLRTDASSRYEKGADISNLGYALHRAAQLICEIAGGEIASTVKDVYPNAKEKKTITVSYRSMNALAGKDYSKKQVKTILSALCFDIKKDEGDSLELVIPFAKPGIEFEADIVEEIMRIDGIDNIPFTGEIKYAVSNNTFQKNAKQEIAGKLVGKGFYEIITNSITNSKYFPDNDNMVRMMNSLTSELDVMRPSMLETALQSIAHNHNRKNEDLKFFEFGKIYSNRKGHYIENERLCLYLSGNQTPHHWNATVETIDIYFCKGLVTSLVSDAAVEADGSVKLGKKKLGSIESVSSEKRKEFGIDKPVWFVDLDWKAMQQYIKNAHPKFLPIPKFPGTTRDLALVLDKGVQYASVEKAIHSVVSDKMVSLDVFDVFESEKLGKDKKSYAVRLEFLDTTKTIVDADVDAEMKKVIASLENTIGAEIRG